MARFTDDCKSSSVRLAPKSSPTDFESPRIFVFLILPGSESTNASPDVNEFFVRAELRRRRLRLLLLESVLLGSIDLSIDLSADLWLDRSLHLSEVCEPG